MTALFASVPAAPFAGIGFVRIGFAAEMMDDEQSITLFIVATAALAVVVALVAPMVIGRLSLRRGVPMLALVGPVLGVLGSLIGTGAMSLSGHDVGYVIAVAVLTGIAAMIVGWRLARPLATDLDRVASTVSLIASGDRSARSGIDRADEVGDLASAVDALGRTLARAEAERGAAEDERRAVVSALSHDLRTPLAALLVSVDALEDGLGDGPTQLRAMRRNVLALERLVEDLFLLARADSGSLALQTEALDLTELLDEALEAVGPSALDKGVSMSAELDAAVAIEGDDTALGRILRNLLDNAVRHAESAVRVEMSTDETSVSISVIDDGPGFDEDFIPRAFERFTQADAARSRHGGAGLGLAITQTLALAHEGSVVIHPGPGGQVTLSLPRVADPAAIAEPSVRS